MFNYDKREAPTLGVLIMILYIWHNIVGCSILS